jgi:hypothetical protein
MGEEPRFALVEGTRLHHEPAWEVCNVDDAKVVQRHLSPADLDALEEESGPFERCLHCWPGTETPLNTPEHGK